MPDSWAEAVALDLKEGRPKHVLQDREGCPKTPYLAREIPLLWQFRLNRAAVKAKSRLWLDQKEALEAQGLSAKPPDAVSLGLRPRDTAELHEWQAAPRMNGLHLQWLALYQFDGLTYKLIADQYGVEDDTVHKAVKRTAKKMGMALRPGRRGPPARKP